MRLSIFLLLAISLLSCLELKNELTASEIIDKAIFIACNNECENVITEFDFRDRHYKSFSKGGDFKFERHTFKDSETIVDIISNSGFERLIGGDKVEVADSMAVKYSSSVNSVHYFVQIPYVLNDKAVQKKLLEEATVKNEPYYKIAISFQEEGGGVDHDDTFVYWVHKENFTVDYLAYEYETDGGGMRFREAYNPRVIEGIRFSDYSNYKPKDLETPLEDLDEEFEKGSLIELSKIDSENIKVILLGK